MSTATPSSDFLNLFFSRVRLINLPLYIQTEITKKELVAKSRDGCQEADRIHENQFPMTTNASIHRMR
jgi:hypothetical protein